MMAYEVIWSPKSLDGLRGLDRQIRQRIVRKTEELKWAPYHFVEKLTDVDAWKLRVGNYRAILDIDEKAKRIEVLKVGHRKQVYK